MDEKDWLALYPPTDQGILPLSAVKPAETLGRDRMPNASSQPLVFAGRYVTALVLSFALSAPIAGSARAEDYPDHAVKIIVPFAAGGTADAVPRLVGDWLSRKWGQPVIIENRTGAGGNIGAEFAYRAAPDGYTLLSSPPPPLVINQNLYPKLGFDPARFEPVIVMAQVPNALMVNPRTVPAQSVAELVEYLRKNPEKLTAATQGNGTTSHLTAELFQVMAKVKLRFIPYRGSAPALQGLLAGDVDLMFDNLGVSLPLAEAGSLRLLAVASTQRLPSLPDMPTIAETLPGFEAVAWYAISAPPGTPKKITDKINADVNEALRQPELQERLKKLSAETFGGSVEKTAKYLQEEVERWGNVIKAANIKLE
jgi:tripartite-type tricarboxylate transporter receptor subunit TctC